MNSLKNILFLGILLAALCGVYFSLNRQPDQPLPPGLSGDTQPAKIELGAPLAMTPTGPAATGGSGFTPPPSMPSTPDSAALASQPPTASLSPPGGVAPPFSAGGSTNPSAVTPPPMGPLPGAPPSPANGRPGVADPFASGNPAPPAGPSSVASNPATGGSLPASPAAQPDAYRPTPEAAALNSLEVIMQQVKQKVSEERFGDALLILSQVYGSPDLPPSQSREITQILDQMAAKVIYSRENWLENPYLVQPGDTLDAIADRYQVPALLLARINGIRDPQNLPPGKSLKVLTGKFSAHVSTDRSELTMMLAGRYAGRFPISLSNDVNRSGGLFTVMKRSQNPTSGVPGSQWLELAGTGGTISIQGTSSTGDPSGGKTRNTIWLSEQDMDDVYGILSVGSRVIIQR